MRRAQRASLVVGMVLLLATVAAGETHVGDWDVTGEITASGNFATFGDSSYVTPFSGWSGSSRMVAVRQPTAVSTGVSSGFMFSNNQTGGSQNIAQLMFLNEAIGVAEKRVAQILVQTGGTTNSGKMYFRVFNGGSATNALTINRFGTVTVGDGLTFPDGETQTTAYMGATSGGASNTAGGVDATVGGGQTNAATGNASTVAGGAYNDASGSRATVGGGWNNTASGSQATISGGESNTASGADFPTIGGGWNSAVIGSYATVGGGESNLVTDNYGTVAGGYDNQAGDNAGTAEDADYATVGGGDTNVASGSYSTVAGGVENVANATSSTIGGGYSNTATFLNATVGGGWSNDATGEGSTIPGGYANTASGEQSFAAGYQANASHDNSFVWGDSGGGGSASTDTFNVHATNGIYLNGALLHASDKNKKEAFETINPQDILANVVKMPVSSWRFKTESEAVRHIGPTAQDFKAAFSLGNDDKYINAADADGVTLAAIQGLNQRVNEVVQEKDAEIQMLKARLAALEEAILKE